MFALVVVFLFSFWVGFGAVVSPGPVSTAIVSQAPRHGWIVGPLVALGHSILELVIVVMIAIGLTSGMASARIQAGIGLVGGVLLLWMGWGMVNDVRQGKTTLSNMTVDIQEMTKKEMVTLGMVTTISNPFWYTWWVTVAADYLADMQALGSASVVVFYLGHISADFAWDTTLSAVVGGGKTWITDKIYRGIILVSGVFLLALGVAYLVKGMRGLGM